MKIYIVVRRPSSNSFVDSNSRVKNKVDIHTRLGESRQACELYDKFAYGLHFALSKRANG